MTRANIGTLAILVLLAATARAQETARVPVASDSKLWIEGTSNLHGWACRTQELDASVELDAAAAVQLSVAPPKALRRVTVKVPVKSLKCGHGAMDNNLYKALNADATPEISYIMATFDAVAGEAKDSFSLKTVGTLTVAGRQQAVSMEVRNALQFIQTARQRITAADASVKAAQEKLESELRLFGTGESTNFLVLTRQNELADSRTRAIAARLNLYKSLVRLSQSTGTALDSLQISLK